MQFQKVLFNNLLLFMFNSQESSKALIFNYIIFYSYIPNIKFSEIKSHLLITYFMQF